MALVAGAPAAAGLARQGVELCGELGDGSEDFVRESLPKAEALLRKNGSDALEAVVTILAEGAHSCKVPDMKTDALNRVVVLGEDAALCFQEAANLRGAAKAMHAVANAYLVKGDPFKATQRAQAGINFARTAGEKLVEANIMYAVIGAHMMKFNASDKEDVQEKEIQRAEELCNEVVSIFQQVEARPSEATAWHRLCNILLAREEPEEAMRASRKALEIFRELGDRAGEKMAVDSLIAAHIVSGDLDEALDEAEKMIKAAKRSTNRREEGEALLSAADVHQHRGESDLSLGRAREAASVYRQADDPLAQAGALEFCLNIFTQREDFTEAVKEGTEIVEVLRDTPHRREHAASLHRLARMKLQVVLQEAEEEKRDHPSLPKYHSMDKENLHDAILTAKQAADSFREAGDEIGEAAVLETLGQTLEEVKGLIMKYEEPALTYYVQKRSEKEQQAVSMWEVPGELGPDGQPGKPIQIIGPNLQAKNRKWHT